MGAVGALAVFALPASARAQTFEQVLTQAADDHPLVKTARFQTDAAKSDISAARASLRPQLSVDAGAGFTDNGAGGGTFAVLPEVRLTQHLFDGGRSTAEVRRRKVRAELLSVGEEAALSDISVQLAQAWIDFARADELAIIGEQQVAALKTLDELVEQIAQFDRGRASDVVMVESRLNQASATLRSREIARDEARARIGELAAATVEPLGGVPDMTSQMPQSMSECIGLAESSPAVRSADLEVREGAAAVDATRNWWMPQLAVEGARTSEINDLGKAQILNGFALRLRVLSLPFDSGAGRARQSAAESSLSSAQSRAAYAQVALRDRVVRLWRLQSEKADRLASLAALIEQADQARDIVFEQFRIGRRSILDVLAYDLERYNVRAQLVNERLDVTLAQYQLLGSVGRIYQAVTGEPARDAG